MIFRTLGMNPTEAELQVDWSPGSLYFWDLLSPAQLSPCPADRCQIEWKIFSRVFIIFCSSGRDRILVCRKFFSNWLNCRSVFPQSGQELVKSLEQKIPKLTIIYCWEKYCCLLIFVNLRCNTKIWQNLPRTRILIVFPHWGMSETSEEVHRFKFLSPFRKLMNVYSAVTGIMFCQVKENNTSCELALNCPTSFRTWSMRWTRRAWEWSSSLHSLAWWPPSWTLWWLRMRSEKHSVCLIL